MHATGAEQVKLSAEIRFHNSSCHSYPYFSLYIKIILQEHFVEKCFPDPVDEK